MIGCADTDQYVQRVNFGIFHGDIEVAVFGEDAGVDQFVFGFLLPAMAICCDKVSIGVGPLWIFIQGFHVGMGGSVVEKEIVLLHILTVIALRVRQTEEAFLQDGVSLVP